MPQLRAAVFGLKVGRGHCRRIEASKRIKLVAAADPDDALKNDLRDLQGFDGPIYDTFQELLAGEDQLDVVSIALPAPLHFDAVKQSLNAGCHVLCEKPPTTTAREAKALVDLAKKKDRVLTWRLQRRFRPDILAARKAILEGKLGAIYRIHVQYTHQSLPLILRDKFRMRKQGGGVFFDIGVHSVDLAWSLLGCPRPTRVVSAHHTAFPQWNPVKKKSDMAEDSSFSMFFFEGGTVVNVECCFHSYRTNPTGHTINMQIYGDKGGLEIPSLKCISGGPEKMSIRTLKPVKRMQGLRSPDILDNFLDAIEGKDDLYIKSEHGVELMKMIEGVVKSADTQKEVKLL